MNTKRLASQLHRSYEGEAWHGPCLRDLLDGVTAEQAAAKPIQGSHSIWELVLHIEAWEREALATLAGKQYESLAGDADWPPVGEPANEAWQLAAQRLQSTTHKLAAAVRAMDDERLKELVGGREFDFYVLLNGVVHHNAYHGGQIALLKRSQPH